MKFSIITCTFNSEKFVKENIDSVMNQKFTDYEHVFIDGFSSDKTIEIIKEYQKSFPEKVKLFQYQAQGIGNAMNKGIEHATGEYIIHLHSDDSFYDKNVLDDVNDFISRKSPELLYGKANFFHTGKKEYGHIIPHRKIYHQLRFWLLMITNYVPHQAVFVKRDIFNKLGKFREDFKNSMDYELWLRLSKNKIQSTFFDRIICNFSMRNDSQSSIGAKLALKENLRIKKEYSKNKIIFFILGIVSILNSRRKFLSILISLTQFSLTGEIDDIP